MIITQLNGGLGNQLFQYAAGLALADKRKTILKCDLSHFDAADSRSYDLDFFKTEVIKATDAEIKLITPDNFLQKALQRLLPAYKRNVYREPHFHFDQHFFSTGGNTYLKGNWQSEKYFKTVETLIRCKLQIKNTHIIHLAEWCNKLREATSVSVHIRRGDYLNPHTLAYHGVLTKEYYHKAIEEITRKNKDVSFYIFSDDMEWVKENIHFDHPHTLMSGIISKSAIEDFYLMQCCRHQIIANSSFSWWAAWLNSNPDKTVIAPKQWFGKKGPKYTCDLIPDDWIKI